MEQKNPEPKLPEQNNPESTQPVVGETKRLSGLAIAAGVAGSTAVGAAAGVAMSRLFSKKHYDLDDDDDETNDNPDPKSDEPEAKHEPKHEPKHEEPKPDTPKGREEIVEDDIDKGDDINNEIVNGGDDVNGGEDGMTIEPLGWYAEEGLDGEDVYYLMLGDPNTGAVVAAIAESVPGSGVYDVLLDLTQDPVVAMPLAQPVMREDIEAEIPNPYIDDDDIGEVGNEEDDEEIIDNKEEDEEEVIDDNKEKDEEEIVNEEDINEEDIDPVECVYEGPNEDLDPEIDEPYIEEDLYPDQDMPEATIDDPVDDPMM